MLILTDDILLKRNDIPAREFESEDGKLFCVIAPGYILNRAAYEVWKLLKSEITYHNLILELHKVFTNTGINILTNHTKTIVETLLKRKLISINGKEYVVDAELKKAKQRV